MVYGWSRIWDKKGKVLIIQKALSFLKSSRAAWRALFSYMLKELGNVSANSDPDVYLHTGVKPDGAQYYKILLVYINDILPITHHKDQNNTMKEILYQLKDSSVGEPLMYLGANVGCVLTRQTMPMVLSKL
jgi:hypothetical protein